MKFKNDMNKKMGINKKSNHAGTARMAHKFILSASHRDSEMRELFKLIFNMTGNKFSREARNITDSDSKISKEEKIDRPSLFEVLDKMKKIRVDHAAQRKKILDSVDPEYKKLFEELWQRRGDLEKINLTQEGKEVLKSALETGILKSREAQDDLNRFLLRMVDENKKYRPSVAEVIEYKDKLIAVQEIKGKINREIKENKPKLLSTKEGIDKITFEITTEIKKIIKQLLAMNTIYQDQYYAGLRKSQDVMLFSYPDKKLKTAELFERELQHLLSGDKIEVTAVHNLLQKFKLLNESSASFGDAETVAFSKMLSEMVKSTETPLSNIEQQYKDKVLSLPSQTPSPKKFR